jgi:hypothetical protein
VWRSSKKFPDLSVGWVFVTFDTDYIVGHFEKFLPHFLLGMFPAFNGQKTWLDFIFEPLRHVNEPTRTLTKSSPSGFSSTQDTCFVICIYTLLWLIFNFWYLRMSVHPSVLQVNSCEIFLTRSNFNFNGTISNDHN